MTKKTTKIPAILILAVFALTFSTAGPAMAGLVLQEEQVQGIQADTMFLPLLFIQNQGQAPDEVEYHASAAGHTILFMPEGIVLSASQDEAGITRRTDITMSFPGASAAPEIIGLDPQPGDANFYLGNDPSQWRENVPIFGSIAYQELYPGIDLRYRGTEGVLKREFVVAPGADPDRIAIAYDGVEGLALDEDGSLAITTPLGMLTDQAPVAYQVVDGVQVPVSVSYRFIDDRTVGFAVGEYDPFLPLVIDPTLLYSSFFGGSAGTYINRVRVDQDGNIWIAGYTSATDLPVQNAYQGSIGGSEDCYLAELNPSGTAALYLTYLGGSGNDAIQGLSIDNSGIIYLGGGTKSDNFPLLSPVIATRHEATTGFVTKLNPSNPPGSQLIYSTFIGAAAEGYSSSSYTGVNAIATDSLGGAWMAGYTKNVTLPVTANASQPIIGGSYDAYLGHFASDGSLSYLTYLGGTADEGSSTQANAVSGFRIMGLGLDPAGNVYVAGSTKSGDFPAMNAYDDSFGGGTNPDAFVAKYNATGGEVYATFLGGSLYDTANDLAVDADGAVYLTGLTYSSDFPKVNPAQGTMKDTRDNFITKLDASGTSLAYSTYWGGAVGNDAGGYGIAVDTAGNAYVVGETTADDFPIINWSLPGGASSNGFVVKLVPDGSDAVYSATIGSAGLSATQFYGIALTSHGDAVIGGRTGADDYPITENAYQETKTTTWNGVISILTERPVPVASFTADPLAGDAPLEVRFTDTSTGSPTSWSWVFGDGGTSNEQNPSHTYNSGGLFTVNLTVTNADGVDSEEKADYINVTEPAVPAPVAGITVNATLGQVPLTVLFTDNSTGDAITGYQWILGDDPDLVFTGAELVHTFAAEGNYSVFHSASNAGGTSWTNQTDYIRVLPPPVPLQGKTDPPTDPDGDGIIEDMNANGIKDFNDVFLFFRQMEWIQANEPVPLFDFNGNGIIDFNDIVRLFREL